MKKRFLLLPLALILGYVLFSSNKNSPAGAHSIDGTQATNATGCGGTGCHAPAGGGSLVTQIALLDSTGAVVTNYTPGKGYFVVMGGFSSPFSTLPVFGMQVTAVKAAGAHSSGAVMAGTFATTGLPALTTNSTFGSLHFCEQTDTIHSDTSTTYGTFTVMGYKETFPWTAPAAGTGTVILYGALVAANGNGAPSGDAYANANDTLRELLVTAPITGTTTTCVGSTTTLSDATSGGTWSSSTTSVATVDASGVVTGVSAGTAVISYTASSGTVTATVTVSAATSAGTISGGSSICIGTSTTLTPSISGGTWSSSASGVASVSGSGVVHGVSAGTAVISYGISGTCGMVYVTKTINVASGIVTGTISGASSVCSGLTATLTDTATGGVWSSGSTSIATVNSSTGVVTGVAAGTANITYTVTNGCGSASTSRAISVVASPSPGTISGIPSLFCAQTSAMLTESTSGGTWTSSNTALATIDSTGTIAALAGGTVTISYSVTNAAGCTVAATQSVSITAGPASSITASGSTSFCYGDVVLNGPTGRGLTYQWYKGTTLIAGATDISYAASTTGSFIVNTGNSSGCSTPSAAVDVTVLSVPVIIATGDSIFCQGNHMALAVNAVGGGYTSVYQWKRNTVNIPGATNTTYNATLTGSYTCFENISGGCTGMTPAVNVSVLSVPTPVITATGGFLLSTATGYASYQWEINGTIIPGATNASYPASSNGTYTVVVTNGYGCSGASAGYILSNLGVENVNLAEWTVYPNPANNMLNISNNSTANTTYTITDMPGRTIATGTVTAPLQQIDISRLTTGNYILKITTASGATRNEMFVKQ